jgi:Transposase DNA-binding/Transposase Tn5 dimerisation domain
MNKGTLDVDLAGIRRPERSWDFLAGWLLQPSGPATRNLAMLATWAQEETRTAALHDRRLNRRFTRILTDLGERPTASIPAACGGGNEITAAYRFFDNDRVTEQGILQPHYDATHQRLAQQQGTILLPQDTTEFDCTRPQQQVDGAGPLDGSSRRGALLHVLHSFTPDGTPLGTVWADFWTRPLDDPRSSAQKKQDRRTDSIEDKESFRWLEGLRKARDVAQAFPQLRCVCIADSEGDIYELFAEPRGGTPVHLLIRASEEDRLLLPAAQQPAATADASQSAAPLPRHLRARVLAAPVLFTKELSVRGREAKVSCDKRARRQPRKSRTAQVEVRAATVTLHPPWRPEKKLPAVTLNVVLVREIDPPADDVPVEWLLVTTLPIETVEQVREIVQYYAVRFLMEVVFRVWKSGCRVEWRRFEDMERLLPCVALYLIVAWRTLYVCRLGRSFPELDCEAVFEPSEWKSVWMVLHQEPPPAQPPSLQEMVCLVAQLGGYINRPNRSDPPGPQTVWLGLQRMRDLAWAWKTFGPRAKTAALQSATADV